MIHDDILDFLRDAQYRIAELTWEINDELREGEIESPAEKHKIRLQLLAFIESLYEVNFSFTDNGYNFILSNSVTPVYTDSWTEDQILDEMEYLREMSGMVDMPLISFGPYWTEVVNIISPSSGGSGGGSGINVTGTLGQFIMFNNSGQPIAVDIDEYGGMLPNETITDYFLGRI